MDRLEPALLNQQLKQNGMHLQNAPSLPRRHVNPPGDTRRVGTGDGGRDHTP